MRKQFSTRLRRRKSFRQKTLNTMTLMVFVLLPIYPAFGSYMQSYTGATVRWEYDSSSIIASYDYSTGQEILADTDTPDEIVKEEATPVAFVEDPVVVPAPPLNTTNPVPPEDKKRSLYMTHTVSKGDTLWSIAQKYSMNIGALKLANNLSNDTLSIGQKVVIPRINGVNYVVKKWDNLGAIAQKYGVSINSILLANDMSNAARLSVGKTLLLPNPTKDPTKKTENVQIAQKPADKKTPTKTVAPPKTPTKKEPAKDPKVITYGSYSLSLKVDKWCRGFVWGNCTCFVAKYKNVTWRGNAKDWYRNAAKAGVDVGQDPRPGAIIVYSGYWFPRAYGHVGIVMEVNDDHIIVKDMNYRALNEITTRRDKVTNPAIVGYIYVD